MGLIPDYKDIAELLKRGLTIEAQEKIMELRVGALGLQEENLKLREQVRDLNDQGQLEARDYEFDQKSGTYWLLQSDQRIGSFCQVCYDRDRKAVRLHDGQDCGVSWLCLVCSPPIGSSAPVP
jgi:hypothetical protein